MMELWWLVWLQISNVVHFNAIYTTLPTCYDSAMFVKLRMWMGEERFSFTYFTPGDSYNCDSYLPVLFIKTFACYLRI